MKSNDGDMSSIPEPIENPRPAASSPWSIMVAKVAGIPIRIHFTFILFFAWVALLGKDNGFIGPVLVLAIFFCVLLHELGHALVAKRYSIRTRDITLYPIGGVAALEGQPKPKQEIWIALAGPLVNLAIVAILTVVFLVTQGAAPIAFGPIKNVSMLQDVIVANLMLAIFNLIPAFPMDGGRVLRALLGLALPEAKATQIAGGVGQALAIVFFLVGILTGETGLLLIGVFVYLGAGQEVSATVTRSFLHGHNLADAMQVRFRTIESGKSLQAAAEMLLEGSQHDFPVVNGTEVLGILLRNDIAHGLATEGPTGYVAGHMHRNFKSASPYMHLERVVEMFSQADSSPILAIDEGMLVGMLTVENLSEFIMIEHAKSQGRSYRTA